MNSETYSVCYGELELAKGMSLGNALILMKALMQEYHNETELAYTLKREDNRR